VLRYSGAHLLYLFFFNLSWRGGKEWRCTKFEVNRTNRVSYTSRSSVSFVRWHATWRQPDVRLTSALTSADVRADVTTKPTVRGIQQYSKQSFQPHHPGVSEPPLDFFLKKIVELYTCLNTSLQGCHFIKKVREMKWNEVHDLRLQMKWNKMSLLIFQEWMWNEN
jgi:hypothetical protein